MKKLLAMLLALAMVMALVACGGGAADDGAADEDAGATDGADTGDTGDADADAGDADADAGDAEADPNAVTRLIVWDNAVLGLESSDQPRGDETRPAYAFADVIAKCEIAGTEPCQVIGSDGYAADEPYDDLVQKYLTMEGEAAPIVVGEAQDPDWAVWNVAYVRIGSDVIMTSYQEEISLAKVFEDIGMAEAESYDFICDDGYVHNAPAEDIAESYIKWVDGRVDGVCPGLGEYTLYSVVYIQPAA